jgi:predicted nucleotidyltransferase
MVPDDYVRSILTRYELQTGEGSPAELAAAELMQPITEWAGRYLQGISFCGSYAKGTRVRGATDIDILVSLGPRTPLDADKLYERLFDVLKRKGLKPNRLSVSIGLELRGLVIQVIPARQEWGGGNDHRIFETEHQRVTRTNLDTHLKVVKESGWVDEIRLMKIWRNLRGLRLPSFCLELAVMDALRRSQPNQPAANMETALLYLKDTFPNAPLRDPANFENRVSDDLLKHEKIAISDAASDSLKQGTWGKVVW